MWFITKLLDTNANHNSARRSNDTAWMWFITKLLDTNANHNNTRNAKTTISDVIYHEITWYECKSQPRRLCVSCNRRCDLSRNYLIRMQITTHFGVGTEVTVMWFITKLLDTNANHNSVWTEATFRLMWFITKLLDTNANHNKLMGVPEDVVDVIYHEITWYECKSQRPIRRQ